MLFDQRTTAIDPVALSVRTSLQNLILTRGPAMSVPRPLSLTLAPATNGTRHLERMETLSATIDSEHPMVSSFDHTTKVSLA